MRKHIFILLAILAFKAVVMAFVHEHALIDLGPDEAQYWTWSKNLDWGYYSKPPGIAWMIALATGMLGDTALAVRSVALFFGSLLPFAFFWFAKRAGLQEKTAFWGALALALIPAGFLAALFTTTDGPYIFFWIVGLALLAKPIEQQTRPNYLLFGVVIGIGALFKWPIYTLWVVVLAGLPFFPSWRSKKAFAGLVLSLVGLLPSLYWNIDNDWATFRHVSATVQGGSVAVARGNAGDFLAAQAGLLFPLLFLALAPATAALMRRKETAPRSVLFFSSLSYLSLLCFVIIATQQKVQGNWALFTVPGFLLLLSWYLLEHASWGKGWLIASLLLSTVLMMAMFAVPTLFQSGQLPPHAYRLNPFRHNVGWSRLAAALEKHGYTPDEHFLFAHTYQNASELYFYGPEQKRSYLLPLDRRRKNQFFFWPSMAKEQTGKTGYFIWVENSPKWEGHVNLAKEKYLSLLAPYFDEVEFLSVEPLFGNEKNKLKVIAIFKCKIYNGKQPELNYFY